MRMLREIKATAATLPVEDRSELLAWLSESSDLLEIRQEELRRETQSSHAHGVASGQLLTATHSDHPEAAACSRSAFTAEIGLALHGRGMTELEALIVSSAR